MVPAMSGTVAHALGTPSPFLGVDASFTGRIWRERLDAGGQATALAMVQRHGVADALARVLAGRGVALDQVDEYLTPTLRTLLPEPYRLTDMEAAAESLSINILIKLATAVASAAT